MTEIRKYKMIISRASSAYNMFIKDVESYIQPKSNQGTPPNPQPLITDSAFEYNNLDSHFPIETSLKNQFERVFDADFSNVKIHTGHYANEMTRNANALAVTVGNDIYFSDGKFNPETEEGVKLLAHELTHVVQNNDSMRLVYLEDLSMAEYMADKAENMFSQLKLHNVTGPLLDQSENSFVNTENSQRSMETITQDSSKPNIPDDSSQNFEDFLKKSDAPVIRYYTKAGEKLDMTLEEYLQGKKMIIEEIENLLEEKRSILPDDQYAQELLKFMEYVNQL